MGNRKYSGRGLRMLVYAAFLTVTLLAGSRALFAAETSSFFFDTTIDIRINDADGEELIRECLDLCSKYELTFSAEREDSELYRINHRTEQQITVSDDMRDCLMLALSFCEMSEGRFDITIYPVSSLWDFHAENPVVPDDGAVRKALSLVDYKSVHLEGNTLTFDSPDTMIDLGAVAKGYISGELGRFLAEQGCTSALINLGGNVRAIGRKSSSSDWKVGIQKPFSARGEILTVIPASDCCVISSGIYERYFEKDNVFYHHIIDPATGYPSDTGLTQVTLIGDNDAACDALATLFFLEDEEDVLKICKEHYPDIRVITVSSDGEMREITEN